MFWFTGWPNRGEACRRAQEKTIGEIKEILEFPWAKQAEVLRSMTRRELEVLCFILTNTKLEEGNRQAVERIQMAVFSILRDYWSIPKRVETSFGQQNTP
jgi:hypothetical protein